MSVHSCPCCDSDLRFVSSDKYEEYICESCDHIYFKSPVEITSQDYEESEKYADYYAGEPPFLWYHKQALRAAKALPTGARILDFGCYDGFFVKRMVDNGLDAYGCDWNSRAIAAGGEKFGLSDRLSRDGDGQYDAITSLEVIEHFEDPNLFVNIVSGLLKPEGRLILSCPNKNSAYRPSTDAPPHHFSRFSVNSLATILGKYGYDVETHTVEYSFLQMTRNYLGDRLRSASTNIDENPEEAPEQKSSTNTGTYRALRGFANKVIPAVGLLATPLDLGMRGLDKPYIAQFVVAQKTTRALKS